MVYDTVLGPCKFAIASSCTKLTPGCSLVLIEPPVMFEVLDLVSGHIIPFKFSSAV